MNHADELEEGYRALKADTRPEGPPNGSGIPLGFIFNGGFQMFSNEERICLFPSGGTCIILHPDGTWLCDTAPFAD